MAKRIFPGLYRPSLVPSPLGERCEILFTPSVPKRLVKGGTWELSDSDTGTKMARVGLVNGAAIGSNDATGVHAKVSVQSQVLQTHNMTIIAAVSRTAPSGSMRIVGQVPGGHTWSCGASAFNLVQSGQRNNNVSGRTLLGEHVYACTKRSSDNMIHYYADGQPYGEIGATDSLGASTQQLAIGSQSGTGASSATEQLQSGMFIYGVAILPFPDNALVRQINSIDAFFRTFFINADLPK